MRKVSYPLLISAAVGGLLTFGAMTALAPSDKEDLRVKLASTAGMIGGNASLTLINDEWGKVSTSKETYYVHKDIPYLISGDLSIEQVPYIKEHPELTVKIVVNEHKVKNKLQAKSSVKLGYPDRRNTQVNSSKSNELDENTANFIKKVKWDCNLFYCKEGDPKVYPIPSKIAQTMGDMPSFIIAHTTSAKRNKGVELVVVFDPDCAYSKSYFKKTVIPLIKEGVKVRVILNSFQDLDRKSERYFQEIESIACDNSPQKALMRILGESNYELNKSPLECTAKNDIKTVKESLNNFSIGGTTPISITPKAIIFGEQSHSTISKILE